MVLIGTLQEYQKRMKKLDQQYKERIRNAGERTAFLVTCLRISDLGLDKYMIIMLETLLRAFG